jgi:hypothetical protein
VQSVTIYPRHGVTRARAGSGRRKLTAVQRTNQLYADRKRHETQTLVVDRVAKFKRHSWLEPKSGEENYKSGDLTDPEMSGKASAGRFKKTRRPPAR